MRDDGNTYIGTRLCWRDHLGCAPVDLQTNLARHLDWFCGWNLATALVGFLVASSVGNLLANLVARWDLHGLARPHRLFFLLFVAYGRLLLSVAHLCDSSGRAPG